MGEVDSEAVEMNGWVVQTDSRECFSNLSTHRNYRWGNREGSKVLLFTLGSTEVSATTGKTRLLSLIKTALCGWVKIELITLIKLAIPIVSDARNLSVFVYLFLRF